MWSCPPNAPWCCSHPPGSRIKDAKRLCGSSTPSSRSLGPDLAESSKERSRRTTSSVQGFLRFSSCILPFPTMWVAIRITSRNGSTTPLLGPFSLSRRPTRKDPSTRRYRDYIADLVPSTVIGLGVSAEILVAQMPLDGATPLVEFLRNAPSGFRGLFALLAERDAFRHILGPEATSPSALRALIDSLEENRRHERETFQFALEATRETMATLATQSGILRDELIDYKEQARLEKAVMQDEYFGRLDELTAKLSTSAARYTRELTIRELALEAREREAERLAGEAAEAQRRLTELLSTSSWRITAPLRLLSRLAGPGRAKDQLPQHD